MSFNIFTFLLRNKLHVSNTHKMNTVHDVVFFHELFPPRDRNLTYQNELLMGERRQKPVSYTHLTLPTMAVV